MTVVNCEHCWLVIVCQSVSQATIQQLYFSSKMASLSYCVLYVLNSKKNIYICTPVGSLGWRRRVVWLDNHVPAQDKEKVFCEKKTWAAVLHSG